TLFPYTTLFRSGALAHARELLPDDAAHRAAHEAELHHRELARVLLDRRAADHHRLAQARRELGLGKPLRVRAEIEELERVVRAQGGGVLGASVLVGHMTYVLECVEM